MPSSTPPGGMRMSVTTTSGSSASTAASSAVEIAADSCDFDVRLRVEQAPDAFAHEVMVVGQHNPNRHASSIRPCRHRGYDRIRPARPDRRRQRTERESSPATCFALPGCGRSRRQAAPRRSHTAREQQPAVILLDIRLPDMDGGDAARALKADARTAEDSPDCDDFARAGRRLVPRSWLRRLPRETDRRSDVPGTRFAVCRTS